MLRTKNQSLFASLAAVVAAAALGAPGMLRAQEAVPAASPAASPAAAEVVQETVVAEATATTAPTIDPAALSALRVGLDTVWVLVTAMLVFFMNTGFAMVESGLCRSKNCVNILAKNFIVFALSSLSFWFLGWNLMFGDGNPFSGFFGFFLNHPDNSPALGEAYAAMNPFGDPKGGYEGVYGAINWTPVPLWAKFFFQLVFAGTAATIVSGAVAERIKFIDFIIFSLILVGLIYPISGHWIWGGGFLASGGDGFWGFFGNFRDFAGSTVVHSVGGWAALAGVIVLGPRLGKYKDGKPQAIPGHNMTSAALGVFILWLGWFGFNPGSTMSAGDGKAIAHILVNTNTAAATGAIGAMITAWILLKKPDLSMILNGCLAGLVAITAPCAFTTIGSGAIIGFIAGILVVLSVLFFDRIQIDDPVGAISVHLVNGIWGTLALGLFWNEEITGSIAALPPTLADGQSWGPLDQVIVQIKGIVAVGVFVFVAALVVWVILKAILGIRVSPDEEKEGLDTGEHGNEAYPDFQPVSGRLV